MNFEEQYKGELIAERNRINAILDAMGESDSAPTTSNSSVRQPVAQSEQPRKRRVLSAAARNKIAAAQRARWAERRKTAKKTARAKAA